MEIQKGLARQSRFLVSALVAALLLLLIAPTDALARMADPRAKDDTEFVDGTYPGRLLDELALRKQRLRLLAKQKMPRAPTADYDWGQIAVIEDDGTLVVDNINNPFDMDNKTFRFTPAGTDGFDVSEIGFSFTTPGGTDLPLGDDTGELVTFTGGFTFPFYGTTYDAVYVHSNGHLTFDSAENEFFSWSLRGFLRRQPRIGVFFDDLDPSNAGTVRAEQFADRFVVTWDAVTEYTAYPGVPTDPPPNSNTVQVRLFDDGTIELVYNGLAAEEAFIGTTPGTLLAAVNSVDYTDDVPTTGLVGAIFERFATGTMPLGEIDIHAVAMKFYETHPDIYDYLIMFTDFSYDLDGAFAYELTMRNDVLGLGDQLGDGPGDDIYDHTASFGSAGRLQSFLNMNEIDEYPGLVNQPVLATLTTMDILGHEAGHRWLAFVRFMDGEQRSDHLLGRALAHWNFFLDTDASFMEGHDWRDNGDGSFSAVAATDRYGPLDLYLMGFNHYYEVPPFFLIQNPSPSWGRDMQPQVNITVTGTRKDIGIESVIAAEGVRTPGPDQSQKVFKQAFIMVVRQGTTPLESDLDKLDNIRDSWESFFREKLDNRGAVDTYLAPDTDTDDDQWPNRLDDDDDGDGTTDALDPLPLDTDNDGFPNDADDDDDADGLPEDGTDPFPFDTDNDWLRNDVDPDDDNDRVYDYREVEDGTDPLDPTDFNPDSMAPLAAFGSLLALTAAIIAAAALRGVTRPGTPARTG